MQRKYFGTTSKGVPVHIFTLESESGVAVEVMEYGASVVSITLPGPDGRHVPIVAGYRELGDYLASATPLGATLGRYAGRISDSAFSQDGELAAVAPNSGRRHHENGGEAGFQRTVWWGEALNEGVRFHCESPLLEDGFPGSVHCTVEYRLDKKGALWIESRATSDTASIVDLSNEIYFNLDGDRAADVFDHDLWVATREVVEADRDGTPTGHLVPIGDGIDLREPASVRTREQAWNPARDSAPPAFVLDVTGNPLRTVAGLRDPRSGRSVEFATTQPSLTIAARDADGEAPQSLCISLRNFPDAPNHAHFPSAAVDVDRPYAHTTVCRFDWIPEFPATNNFAG